MKRKSLPTPRNPQDMIDDTYNARDFEIENKDMNAYVMPLDMVRDVDFFDPKYFYEEQWETIMKGE
ncbi:hypothetical protein [Clostridium formicaceticum]|uniref:Uncharacterized protein n=1 Tax=Clostridium formicaceticum TaxID=1497 RepID=A0AAC9RHE0_9CLOT|nr:hypothetical protein [Clostridium formicaceticum]AOY75770.1 hypothetical protein BJL90_07580 [Clostridium formicaceticum]ARE86096.1 hypothetical protein CLFO_04120 [Clostridium formicaceticum]